MITNKYSGSKGIPFPELRGKLTAMRYPALTELKLDGEYCVIFYKKRENLGGYNKCITINKYGRVRENFPALMELETALDMREAKSCTLISELYFGEGKLNDNYKLNSNKESDALKLHVHDVSGVNGMHIGQYELSERKEILFDLIGLDLQARVKLVENEGEVNEQFIRATLLGYEGIVVKSLDSKLNMGPCDWVKMKKKDRNDYQVSEIDRNREKIVVRIPLVFPEIGNTFLGVKAPNKYKKHISIGDIVTIEHQGVLPSGRLKHPVLIPRKEWL